MWNNCVIWAHWRRMQLWREWTALGRPKHRVPAVLRRPSRQAPPWIDHRVVGWWHPVTAVLEAPESFCPDSRDPLPWWRLWQVLIFRGHIEYGDTPSNH